MSRRLAYVAAYLVMTVEYCQAADVLATLGSYRRFLDEPAALTYGVAVNIPVTRRFSVRPEVLVDNGRVYSNLLGLASVTGDFTDPEKVAVGYWVASAGGVRTREEFFTLNSWQWAVLGGVGVRFAPAEHWTAAAEFRAGWPAFPLVTFNVGYRWGR